MDPILIALTLIGLGVFACLGLLLRKGENANLTARIDTLEATLKEAQSGAGKEVVAQLREGLEAKHRTLSESLSELLENRTRRIEETVRQLKEANQEQLLKQERELRELTDKKLSSVQTAIGQLKTDTATTLGEMKTGLTKSLTDALTENREGTVHSVQKAMKLATDTLNENFTRLQKITDDRLNEISGKVTERLDAGFKKTTETFTDVVKRLAIIDEAQKKIADLSQEMVSLQDILSDKKSRGVFGEVQLGQLVANTLPEGAYALQHSIVEGKIADCVLFLPEPTGTVAVDAKFPLDNYRRMFDRATSEADRQAAGRQFKQDIKKHINDIADKYIIPGKTSDGAVMFIPAEAVFAEIHGHQPELVELAQKRRVWITSPTTMMAILTTARAVLKDAKTRKQVHIIQEHLGRLAGDFSRFQDRMDRLGRHIQQAGKDVDDIGISARKITNRFERIERVQLDDETDPPLDLPPAEGNNDGPPKSMTTGAGD